MSKKIPETKKQYVTTPAPFGGTTVYLFINGRSVKSEIVKDSMLQPYTESVENLGYRRAYCIPVLERRLEKAYAAYREAVETLEKAKPYPLELDEKETEKLMEMLGGEE